jgi:hypothetical protein
MSKSTLISVAFHQSPSNYMNMLYFLHHGILPQYDYVIAINGDSTIHFPTDLPNVKIIRRPNTGFDFGAHEDVLSQIGSENLSEKYDFFIFMNASVIGPIHPDLHVDWVQIFRTRFMRDEIGLLGTTIVCLPAHDAGGLGPRVEGFFWCTDYEGLSAILAEKTILRQHPTKYSAIVSGEYGLSRCILRHGRNLGCMLNRYQGIDWRDPKEWYHNNQQHPSRHNTFYGASIDPYEVIFHKWFWHGNQTVQYDIIEKHVILYNKKLFGNQTLSFSSYRDNNPDLQNMTDPELEKHFFILGIHEHRIFS